MPCGVLPPGPVQYCLQHSCVIAIYIYVCIECSPMARETWVQSQVESYQRLKKWYLMPPCLTLSIIRYGSRVKWSNPGKGVAPSPTPWCSKLSKREPSGHPRLWSPTLLTLYIYIIYEYAYMDVCIYVGIYLSIYMYACIYTYICVYLIWFDLIWLDFMAYQPLLVILCQILLLYVY